MGAWEPERDKSIAKAQQCEREVVYPGRQFCILALAGRHVASNSRKWWGGCWLGMKTDSSVHPQPISVPTHWGGYWVEVLMGSRGCDEQLKIIIAETAVVHHLMLECGMLCGGVMTRILNEGDTRMRFAFKRSASSVRGQESWAGSVGRRT